MPSIDTLVPDIHAILSDGHALDPTAVSSLATGFGSGIALKITDRITAGEVRVRDPKTLFMSEIGKPCTRQLWYSVNEPDGGEELTGKTRIKFLYGDLLEDAILLLASAAGHLVERNQERCSFSVDGWNVRGRIDAVIDGVLVDVKTASKYSYEKFVKGLDDTNDSFGYRAQLHGYNYALNGNDNHQRQGFLVIEKTNGDVTYVDSNDKFDIVGRVSHIVSHVEAAKAPKRHFRDVAEGTSGNRVLGTECSYCAFKHKCWSDANGGRGLRTFLYSQGPKFATEVVREPKVFEVT